MDTNMTSQPIVQIVDWSQAESSARKIRDAVFIVEQMVPIELEWDHWDSCSDHALALDDEGHPIGTARLLPDGHLGRMAVLDSWRGRGVGRALAQALMRQAKARGMQRIVLHSQVHASGFYRKLGFAEFGAPFDEAGIPHIAMTIELK